MPRWGEGLRKHSFPEGDTGPRRLEGRWEDRLRSDHRACGSCQFPVGYEEGDPDTGQEKVAVTEKRSVCPAARFSVIMPIPLC